MLIVVMNILNTLGTQGYKQSGVLEGINGKIILCIIHKVIESIYLDHTFTYMNQYKGLFTLE